MSEIERTSKVKDGNYYVVQSFMVKELKLKGLELACYAIIYGFSQADGTAFNGSLQYLADWTCSSKQAIMNALKKLVEKGFLNKKDNYVNGVKFVSYEAIYEAGMQDTSMGGGKESCIPPVKKVDLPMQETCTNTLEDNLGDNIDLDTKDKKRDKKDKENERASAHDDLDFNSFKEKEEYVKPNAWSLFLIQKGYMQEDDIYLAEYNDFLSQCNSTYGSRLVARALTYFTDRFNGFDENGERIVNRLAYLRTSLTQGLEKVSRGFDKNDLIDVAKSLAESWGL